MKKPRTRLEIVEFLKEHPRHGSTYAKCVKIAGLGLTSEQRDACYNFLEEGADQFVYSGFSGVLQAFDVRHDYAWRIYQEGRSGGWLELSYGLKGEPNQHRIAPLDEREDFSTWDTSDLRARLELVWDFDKTCQRAVDCFVECAVEYAEHKARHCFTFAGLEVENMAPDIDVIRLVTPQHVFISVERTPENKVNVYINTYINGKDKGVTLTLGEEA